MTVPEIVILRPQDYRQMPWKNGKGVTIEIAVYPNVAALEDFDWRVSMATVSEDGLFSSFPGIDRTLSVLEGNGLELFVEGDRPVRLTTVSPPHAFAADKQTHARLIDGPLTDFNVMTRRSQCRHAVEMITASTRVVNENDRTVLVAYCHAGTADVDAGCISTSLQEGETAIVNGAQAKAVTFELASGARIYLARFSL